MTSKGLSSFKLRPLYHCASCTDAMFDERYDVGEGDDYALQNPSLRAFKIELDFDFTFRHKR